MNGWTRVLLVLLRLAIGWHFMIEGLEKLHSVDVGPTTTNKPWSSEVYLRESTGPLASYFRELAGDTDESVVDRLTLQPLQQGQDPEGSARARLSPELEAEWDELFQRLIQQPDRTEQQRKTAETVLEQQKELTARWLYKGERVIKKSFPSGVAEVKETTRQRVEEMRTKLQELRKLQSDEMPRFQGDVAKTRLASLKTDVRRYRAELLEDLKEQMERTTVELQKALGLEGKPPPVVEKTWQNWGHLEWIDFSVRWGLTIVGACLIAGLLTRTSCLAGAGFLLMFYLAMPPFPGVPDNPRAEGHYLYINKNIIEMLALLALATTRSGRWFGLDGLVQFLNPKRWKPKPPLAA